MTRSAMSLALLLSVSPGQPQQDRPAPNPGRSSLLPSLLESRICSRRCLPSCWKPRLYGKPATWSGGHGDRLSGASHQCHRRVSGIHRYRTARDSGRAAQSRPAGCVPPGEPRVSTPFWSALAAAARLSEHVCHSRAPGDCSAISALDAERLGSGLNPSPGRAHRGLHRASRWSTRHREGLRDPVPGRARRCCPR